MPPNTLDPQAVAMAKAIRQQESGGDFKVHGKSGEYGAYQFMPDTFASSSQKYLGKKVDIRQATPEQQNEVAYHQVKDWKDAGYNPGQIASMWNAGQGEPDAYTGKFSNGAPSKGINKHGVAFDVPAYATGVAKYYQEYKGQSGGYNPTPYSKPADGSVFNLDLSGNTPEQPQNDSIGGKLGQRATDASVALQQTAGGQINPLSGILQTLGAAGGAVGDITSSALENTPVLGGLVKGAEGLIGKGAGALANTGPGKAVVNNVSEVAKQHPELAADIGAVGNIVTALPILKGVGLAKNAIVGGAKKALVGGTSDAVYEAVAPKLGPKALAKAISTQGTSQKGLLNKTVLNENKQVQNIAEAVKREVPKFNPNAPVVEQIAQVQKAVDSSVEKLKNDVIASGSDRIFSPNELKGVLNNIETPISLRGTPFEKQLKPLKDAFIKISEDEGGKVSSLLPALQKFDQLVTKTYGDAFWTREAAPMRNAVKEMRDAVASFAEKRLPPEIQFRERRLTQSRLIRAIENMATKAATGTNKEIGTNSVGRFMTRHPGIKGLVRFGKQAAATGLGVRGAENLIP